MVADASVTQPPRWVVATPTVAGWLLVALSAARMVQVLLTDRTTVHLLEAVGLLALGLALATHHRRLPLSRLLGLPVIAVGATLMALDMADTEHARALIGTALAGFGLARVLGGRPSGPAARIGGLAAATAAAVVAVVGLEHVFELGTATGAADHFHEHGAVVAMLLVGLLGLVAVRADRFPVNLLVSSSAAGSLTRRLLPAVILAPPLLGQTLDLLRNQAHLSDALSLAIAAGGGIVVLISILSVSATRVHRAEQARGDAYVELEAILAGLPVAVTITDLDSRIVRASSLAQRLLSPHAPLHGQRTTDLYPAEIREEMIEQGRRALEGATTTREYRTRFAGEQRWWDVTRFPVHDASGATIGVGTVALDVTASRRAALVASAASARLRSYLDTAPDATIMVDRHGIIRFANRRVAELLGYEPGELMGHHVDQLVPEEIRAGHAHQRASYMERPQHRAMGHGQQLLALRKNGTTIAVEISLGPVETEDGTWVAAALRDVTERRAAEAALRDAEQRARHLADHDPLTGVANRRRLELDLAAHLSTTREAGGLLIIDVDHFKHVNDAAGHPVGDTLLQDVVRVVGACLPPGGFLSRLGGDEFAILLTAGDEEEVARAAHDAVRAVRALPPIETEFALIRPTVSIGVAPFATLPAAERTSKGALVHADDALYSAKGSGRDRYVVWSPGVRRERGPARAATLDRNGGRHPTTRSEGRDADRL